MVLESRPGYYPEIILPGDLKAAMQAVPPVPVQPVRPVVPTAPDKVSTFNFGFIVLGGGSVMAFLAPEIGIIGVGFGIVLLVLQHFSIQTAKRTYNREQNAYTAAVSNMEAYPGKLLLYQQEVARYQDPKYAEQYRREQIARELKTTSEPTAMTTLQQLTIRKGTSEAAFEQFLKDSFGATYIQSTLCLRIGYSSSDNSYYPDFVYSHPSGLRIDIEIDEPYTGATKQPIHCRGQDNQRNSYFAERGWVVVRFAEQQIVTQPKLCCQLLAGVIAQLLPGQAIQPVGSQMPSPVPKWTSEQAKEMALLNIRTSYSTSTF